MLKLTRYLLLAACCILTAVFVTPAFSAAQKQETLVAEIGPDGGSLSSCDQATGKCIVVRFPPKAVKNKTRFELIVTKNTVKVKEGESSPVAFNIYPDMDFNEPIEVDIEYDITNTKVNPDKVLAIPYSIDQFGRLHLAQIKHLNHKDKVLTVSTFRGGKYFWVLDYSLARKR